MPPDFSDKQIPFGYICHFCKQGKNTIFVENIMYTKNDVVTDYKGFMNKLAQSGNVKDAIRDAVVEGTVKKHGLQ